MGYAEDQKGYHIYDPKNKLVVTSRDARFVETEFYADKNWSVGDSEALRYIPVAEEKADTEVAEDKEEVSDDDYEEEYERGVHDAGSRQVPDNPSVADMPHVLRIRAYHLVVDTPRELRP